MIQLLKTTFIASFIFVSVLSYSNEVEFMDAKSWESIVKKARSEDKGIFVEVYTDWCSYCIKLDKEVFNVTGVANFYNENFINVKLNAEDEGVGTSFAELHEIKGYPTLMYFDSKGKWVHRISGYRDVEGIINAGWDAKNEDKQLVTFQYKFSDGNTSLEFLRTYINALNEAGLDNTTAVNAYVSQLSDVDIIEEDNWNIIETSFYDTQSEQFDRLLSIKAALETKFGTAAVNKYFESAYAREIYKMAQRKDKGELEKFKQEIQSDIPELADKFTTYADFKFHEGESDNHAYSSAYLSVYCSNFRELNAAAWKYYEEIDDEALLNEALFWAQKSVRLDENWFNTDTYAHLLYKLGKNADAKQAALRSIEVATRDGYDPAETKALLEKIESQNESR